MYPNITWTRHLFCVFAPAPYIYLYIYIYKRWELVITWNKISVYILLHQYNNVSTIYHFSIKCHISYILYQKLHKTVRYLGPHLTRPRFNWLGSLKRRSGSRTDPPIGPRIGFTIECFRQLRNWKSITICTTSSGFNFLPYLLTQPWKSRFAENF